MFSAYLFFYLTHQLMRRLLIPNQKTCNVRLHVFFSLCLCFYLRSEPIDYYLIKYLLIQILYLIAVIDHHTMYIYNLTLYLYGTAALIYACMLPFSLVDFLIKLVICLLLQCLNHQKERLGRGDLYLMMITALYLPYADFVQSLWIACLCGMVSFCLHRQKECPFAPCLVLGIMIQL